VVFEVASPLAPAKSGIRRKAPVVAWVLPAAFALCALARPNRAAAGEAGVGGSLGRAEGAAGPMLTMQARTRDRGHRRQRKRAFAVARSFSQACHYSAFAAQPDVTRALADSGQ
jgi:hypothetical protein